MKVSGMDYAKLSANAALEASFVDTVKTVIVDSSGGGVAKEDVSLKLSAGSVVVNATISLRTGDAGTTGDAANSVQSTLSDAANAIASSVTTLVQQLEGVDAVTTGTIATSTPVLSLQPRGTSLQKEAQEQALEARKAKKEASKAKTEARQVTEGLQAKLLKARKEANDANDLVEKLSEELEEEKANREENAQEAAKTMERVQSKLSEAIRGTRGGEGEQGGERPGGCQ